MKCPICHLPSPYSASYPVFLQTEVNQWSFDEVKALHSSYVSGCPPTAVSPLDSYVIAAPPTTAMSSFSTSARLSFTKYQTEVAVWLLNTGRHCFARPQHEWGGGAHTVIHAEELLTIFVLVSKSLHIEEGSGRGKGRVRSHSWNSPELVCKKREGEGPH